MINKLWSDNAVDVQRWLNEFMRRRFGSLRAGNEGPCPRAKAGVEARGHNKELPGIVVYN
jgi:hypothetical protein